MADDRPFHSSDDVLGVLEMAMDLTGWDVDQCDGPEDQQAGKQAGQQKVDQQDGGEADEESTLAPGTSEDAVGSPSLESSATPLQDHRLPSVTYFRGTHKCHNASSQVGIGELQYILPLTRLPVLVYQ